MADVEARANQTAAASAIGVSRDTWGRWVRRLGLCEWMEQAEKVAKLRGWHYDRPLGAEWK